MGFKIRKIFDDLVPANKALIEQIIDMTRSSISDMEESWYESMREMFRNPVKANMRYIFFAASDLQGRLKAFAMMSHCKNSGFSFLDLLVTDSENRSGGIGSSLYERVRNEAIMLKSCGLFLECIGDDPENNTDKMTLKQNRARLRFYEKYHAYPIKNEAYSQNNRKIYGKSYYLLYDQLDHDKAIESDQLKKVIKTILEKKYEPPCSKDTIKAVLDNIEDGPVCLRKPRYKTGIRENRPAAPPISEDMKIILVYNRDHRIHHITEKGYAESPVRVENILSELEKSGLFRKIPYRKYSESWITAVHDSDFVSFFKRITRELQPDETIYPDVFPIRKEVSPPRKLITRAGYYCIDVYSPINRNAYLAARAAVNCALTAADELLIGNHLCYALVRPPGHHADSKSFGGFCYFNSTAIAANYLSDYGKVAILDVDYHHGNGQEEIFYSRDDILTLSIHGDPNFEYPHFSGFKQDTGYGEGLGFNANFPLPAGTDGEMYRRTLRKAIKRIQEFGPHFLLVAFGLDTAKGDPIGSWLLGSDDFRANGALIGNLALPTLVIQEGGYNNEVLGTNAREFFRGLWETQFD